MRRVVHRYTQDGLDGRPSYTADEQFFETEAEWRKAQIAALGVPYTGSAKQMIGELYIRHEWVMDQCFRDSEDCRIFVSNHWSRRKRV